MKIGFKVELLQCTLLLTSNHRITCLYMISEQGSAPLEIFVSSFSLANANKKILQTIGHVRRDAEKERNPSIKEKLKQIKCIQQPQSPMIGLA